MFWELEDRATLATSFGEEDRRSVMKEKRPAFAGAGLTKEVKTGKDMATNHFIEMAKNLDIFR